MTCLPRPGRGHKVACREIAHAFADFDHFAGDRVSDRPALRVQIGSGSGRRRRHRSNNRRLTQARHPPFEDLRNPSCRLARVAKAGAEIVARQLSALEVSIERAHVWRADAVRPQRRHFGADADQRISGSDQHRAALRGRPWHPCDNDAAHVHH
jgi:hypothetical protein